MAYPKLTPQNEDDIIVIIKKWDYGLTWRKLVSRIRSELEIEISRQALDSYKSIAEAYKNQKEQSRNKVKSFALMDSSKSDVSNQSEEYVRTLEQKITILEERVRKQLAFIEEIAIVAKTNPEVMKLLNRTKERIRRQIGEQKS